MGKLGAWFRAAAASDKMPDLGDVATFGGLALVGYGAWQVYPPAAMIVCGAALFWLGVS